MTETWRPVVGYETRYEVSNHGRVRTVAGRLMTLVIRRYTQVSLTGDDQKARSFHVHTLVLNAFVGSRPFGLQCRHLDGDPHGNRLSNLIWGTPKKNAEDRDRHGTTAKGERQGLNKLSVEQVRQIKLDMVAPECNVSRLAARYGVSRGLLYNIKNGLSWGWVDSTPATSETALR